MPVSLSRNNHTDRPNVRFGAISWVTGCWPDLVLRGPVFCLARKAAMLRISDVEEFQRRLTNTLRPLRSGPIVWQPGARCRHSRLASFNGGYSAPPHSIRQKTAVSLAPARPAKIVVVNRSR